MNALTDGIIQYISTQDTTTLAWQAALIAAALAAVFLYGARERRTRQLAIHNRTMRSRSDLRSRGA